MNWLVFALLTVAFWGLYGIFLHAGQVGMADKELGRYKAFLFVGVAYFITAVLAPLIVLAMSKDVQWSFPARGLWLSLLAGILGAAGAFCVLLSLGAGIKVGAGPAAVMSIVFAGAPVVNAVVAIAMHPPKGGIAAIPWQFFGGIMLAALGGFLVTKFKPNPAPPAGQAPAPPPAVAPLR
jgi:hypothetical protein